MNLSELGQLVDDAEIQGPDRLSGAHQWALVEVARMLWVNLTFGLEYGGGSVYSQLVQDLANVVVEES